MDNPLSVLLQTSPKSISSKATKSILRKKKRVYWPDQDDQEYIPIPIPLCHEHTDPRIGSDYRNFKAIASYLNVPLPNEKDVNQRILTIDEWLAVVNNNLQNVISDGAKKPSEDAPENIPSLLDPALVEQVKDQIDTAWQAICDQASSSNIDDEESVEQADAKRQASLDLIETVNQITLDLVDTIDQLPFLSVSVHGFLKRKVNGFLRIRYDERSNDSTNSLKVHTASEFKVLATNLKQFIEDLCIGQLFDSIYSQAPVALSGAAFDFYAAFVLTAARIIKDDGDELSLTLPVLSNFIQEREFDRVQYIIDDSAKQHNIPAWFVAYSLLNFKGSPRFTNTEFEYMESFVANYFAQYYKDDPYKRAQDEEDARKKFISIISYSLLAVQKSIAGNDYGVLIDKVNEYLISIAQSNSGTMLDQLACFSAYVQAIAILAKYWSLSSFIRYKLAREQVPNIANTGDNTLTQIDNQVHRIFFHEENLNNLLLEIRRNITSLVNDIDNYSSTPVYFTLYALHNFCLGWFSNPAFLAKPTDLICLIACYINSLHLLIKQQVGNKRLYTDCLSCYKQYCLALQQLINYQLFDFSLFLSYENQLFEQLTLDNKQANTDDLTQRITIQTNHLINGLISELNHYIPAFDNELAKLTQAIFWSSVGADDNQLQLIFDFAQHYNHFIMEPYDESARTVLLASIVAIDAMNNKRVLQVTVPAFTLSTMLLIAGIVILGLVSTGLLCSGYGTALGVVGLCVTGSLAVSAGLMGVGYASYFNWGIKRKFSHLIASVFKLVSNINDQIEISQFKTALIQTKIKHIHQEAMGSPLSMHLSTYQQPKSYASQFATGTANFFSHYVCQPSRRVLASMCCQV